MFWHLTTLAFLFLAVVRTFTWLNYRRDTRRRYYMTAPRRVNHDIVDIAGEIRAETERAWRFYDGKTYAWLPKSQCEWDKDSGTMAMPERLALEKGLL